MIIPLPLLANVGEDTFPSDKKCPLCAGHLEGGRGVAYVYGGACIVDAKTGDTLTGTDVESYLSVGFHGADAEVSDSVHADIVKGLQHDQFHIYLCTFGCLRKWINNVIDELEAELSENIRRHSL